MKSFLLISTLIMAGELGIGLNKISGQSLDIIEAAAPGYPISPSGGREAGDVRVKIVVSAEGLVSEAKAYSGPSRLRPFAEAAALKWKFSSQNGVQSRELVFAFIQGFEFSDPPQVSVLFKFPNRIEVFGDERKIKTMADPPMVDLDEEKKRGRTQ